jgi:hypothetical protein
MSAEDEMRTPTPRTDAAQFIQHDMTAVVSADFARKLERELAAEREKVRTLRLACERIAEQWDKNHDANPIGAGGRMYTLASAALSATEDAQ